MYTQEFLAIALICVASLFVLVPLQVQERIGTRRRPRARYFGTMPGSSPKR